MKQPLEDYIPLLTQTKEMVTVFGIEAAAKKLKIHVTTVQRRLNRYNQIKKQFCPEEVAEVEEDGA